MCFPPLLQQIEIGKPKRVVAHCVVRGYPVRLHYRHRKVLTQSRGTKRPAQRAWCNIKVECEGAFGWSDPSLEFCTSPGLSLLRRGDHVRLWGQFRSDDEHPGIWRLGIADDLRACRSYDWRSWSGTSSTPRNTKSRSSEGLRGDRLDGLTTGSCDMSGRYCDDSDRPRPVRHRSRSGRNIWTLGVFHQLASDLAVGIASRCKVRSPARSAPSTLHSCPRRCCGDHSSYCWAEPSS